MARARPGDSSLAGRSIHMMVTSCTVGSSLFFCMVTARDVLKVLWFSDNIQIISKNFNNYCYVFKSLFTINRYRRNPSFQMEVLLAMVLSRVL